MVRLLRKKGQPIFILMIFLTLLISVPFQSALAALIETETVINPDRVKDTRFLLNQLMAREDVRTALLSYGINPVEIEECVAAMTDSEILQVKQAIDQLPAGGQVAPTEGLVVIVVLTILAFVVLLVLLISGGVYAGIKLSEQDEQKKQEYSKSIPYPAPPRVGPVPSVNPDGPWTGVWRVIDGQDSRVYVLKQAGNSVVSTSESDFRVEAKVYGAMIVGGWYSSTGSNIRNGFKAIIADDFLSFKGDINSQTFFTCQKMESKSAAVNVKPAEPWTGKWKVSSGRNPGIWSLTQNGDTVISTSDSDFKLEAKVYGAMIRGKWSTKGGTDRDFQATIVEDGLSFNGAADYTALRDYFTAKKIE
jgi:predicted nuclease of predicted toxin-antitoxin system